MCRKMCIMPIYLNHAVVWVVWYTNASLYLIFICPFHFATYVRSSAFATYGNVRTVQLLLKVEIHAVNILTKAFVQIHRFLQSFYCALLNVYCVADGCVICVCFVGCTIMRTYSSTQAAPHHLLLFIMCGCV